MRILFAGTPDFAARILEALADSKHEIIQVLTQPDKPAGRGQRRQPSAVKILALQRGLSVFQPENLKEESVQKTLRDLQADVFVVAAYGLILPQAVLDIPTNGCFNVHASLLPRWRGAAPIQRAILSGDLQTGISIMQMEAGLDTGPVLKAEQISITPQDNAGSLEKKLSELGAQMILEALDSSLQASSPQPQTGITYANKIDKNDLIINWNLSAEYIERQIRAFSPVPGACTHLGETLIKIYRAGLTDKQGRPGEILEAKNGRIIVACGSGALEIFQLQKAGGKRLEAQQFLCGVELAKHFFN